MDDELLAEWLDFCAGRSEQEDWYFSGLLQGVTDADTLATVFAAFPHADELRSRALDVLAAGHWGDHLYLQPAIAGDAQARAAAARAWLEELARVAGAAGEPGLQAMLREVPVVAAPAERLEAALRGSGPADYLHDVICDAVHEARTRRCTTSPPISIWAGTSPSPWPRRRSTSPPIWRSGGWADVARWSRAPSWSKRTTWNRSRCRASHGPA